MKDYLKIYKNRKVLITGCTGFKGSWLSYILYNLKSNVIGYSLPPITKENHFEILGLENKINMIYEDIEDYNKLIEVFEKNNPEFVFHLAAQSIVRKSYEQPQKTLMTNIIGSLNVLEAVKNTSSVKSLIYVTSDKCYENNDWIWGYRENDKLGGIDPYSVSKASAELIFNSYLKCFFIDKKIGLASVRAGNVIGGGDWAEDRIIPDCIRSIKKEIKINIRNPKSTRPWQHVLEPLSGYLLLGAKLFNNYSDYNGAWNFGPSTKNVKTVEEITNQLIKILGKGKIEFKDNSSAYEAKFLQLNCDKAMQLLNWSHKWSIDETLEKTALWYKSYLNNENLETITSNQIKEYFNL